MKNKFAILSLARGFHGWFMDKPEHTPVYSVKENAKAFDSFGEAKAYAKTELFCDDSAFDVVAI